MKAINSSLPFGVVVLVAAIVGALVPYFANSYWVIVVLNLAMWIALAQSWTLFSGMTGYISLGHVVFYGLGGYIVASTFHILPLWISIPLGGVVAGLFALIVAVPVLRVRGPYFVILTLGLAELVKYSVLNLETVLGKSSRLLFGAPDVDILLYVMLVLAVVATFLTHLVAISRFGRGLIAIREDETAAETIGVPVITFKVAAFVMSAVIPGMVGGVMALRSTFFETLQIFNPILSFTIVTMAIVGGSGDARGPLLGAAFMVALSELLWSSAPQLYMIFLGVFLILFVVFAPNGIVALIWRQKGSARP